MIGCIQHFNLQNKTFFTSKHRLQARLICDASEKEKILLACHSDPTSGHLASRKKSSESENCLHGKGLTNKLIELVGVTRSIFI